MFTVNHFIWLALCTGVIAAGLIAAVRKKMEERTASRIMAAICFISESSKMMTHLLPSPQGGMALDPLALPFHLCSILIFAVLYINLSENKVMKQKVIGFVVPAGLLGGIAAMLIPIDGVDFLDVLAYQSFLYHAGLCWYALYFIVTKQVDLGPGTYVRNLCALLGLVGLNLYVNGALFAYGTNFMFLTRPPMEGLPVLNLDHGWYGYFATLLGLGFVLLTAVHLPFLRRKN